MVLRLLILALAAFIPAAASRAEEQNKVDPAAELVKRTYSLTPLDGDVVAGGTTYGVALFRLSAEAPAGEGRPRRLDAPFAAALLPDSVNSVLADAGRLYAANGPRGVKVFEIAPGGDLRLAADIPTPGAALRMAVSGDRLFVAMGVSGLGIFDVKDLNDIRPVGVHDTGGYARDVMVTVAGGEGPESVFVANGKGGIVAMRLKQDLRIASAARLELAGDVRRIIPFKDGLLFSLGTKGVCFVPADLEEGRLACTPNGDVARDLLPVGNAVYVADGGAGLTIMDWTDTAAPRTVRSLVPESGSLNGLLLMGQSLYAAADYYGVYVYDLKELSGNQSPRTQNRQYAPSPSGESAILR